MTRSAHFVYILGERTFSLLRTPQAMVAAPAPTRTGWVRFLRGVPFSRNHICRCGDGQSAATSFVSLAMRTQRQRDHQGQGVVVRRSVWTRDISQVQFLRP